MERELIMTGIGGQGIQLAAAVVARAAVEEGREVQVFGSYGGMMRGGATESTVVIADAPGRGPSDRRDRLVGHPHAPRPRRPRVGLPAAGQRAPHQQHRGRPGLAVGAGCEVVEVPASDLAVEAGHIMAASMVMIGAYAAADRTGLAALAAPRPRATSLPAYRAQHAALNEQALEAGFASVEPGSVPAWPERVTAG